MPISFSIASTNSDLNGILKLQRANLAASISEDELHAEGFVTVEHDFALLKRMNSPYPHVIARDGDLVIGYTLVMLPEFREEIPVLIPMFQQFDKLIIDHKPMSEVAYCVMGQVCIARAYRGQGILGGLYAELSGRLRGTFKYLVTEVSLRNPRSLRAHEKVGFETLHQYQSDDGEQWAILILML